MWNEPNNGFRFWKPTLNGNPAGYGALLLAANEALLTAQPQVHVAYAGTVYNDLVPGPSFVAQSFAKTPGLAKSLGTFAVHAYETYPPSRGPESAVGQEVPLVDKVATMSGVLAAAGAKPAPIWVTEIGWPVTTQIPLSAQARYTVRAIALGALAGADRLYLYTLLDGPNPTASPPEDAFGLCTYSDFSADAGTPSEKPAFVGVKALLGAVGAFHVEKRLPATPSDVYLVQLAGPGGAQAWVVWRATDGAAPAGINIPYGGPLTAANVDGSSMPVPRIQGAYDLEVGPDPVVVVAH